MRTMVFVMGLVIAMIAGAVAIRLLGDALISSSAAPGRIEGWPGRVHLIPPAAVQWLERDEDEGLGIDDGRDVAPGWIDITHVNTSPGAAWVIELGSMPPEAARLSGAGQIVSYGLVFETTGDDVADIEVGISNDAPVPGEFRVWMTDLTTGETQQQLGPPYGLPIEFRHPDESGAPQMLFTFLSVPRGLIASSRFYAWASMTAAGAVVASDFAPNASWLIPPPGS